MGNSGATRVPKHGTWYRRLAIPLLVATLSTIAFPGCDTEASDDLWDPDAPVGEAPVIESIDSPAITLAGVDILTINGQNFSTDVASNVVFFDAVRVPVLEATATQIRVRAPNTPKTGVQIRVAVIGGDAESFSNVVSLDLLPATEEFGDTLPSEQPYAMATDADGNLFVSIFQGGVSVGIRRITPEGEASQYYTSTFRWDGLDFGPDGALYGARGVRALFRFPPEGGTQATWAVEGNTSVVFSDLDFDNLGNVWAVGDNDNIYRVAADKAITAFPFSGDIRAVKVAGSDLFAAVMGEGGGEI
ncbi:MAG: IPT/TIG domain-containing protein, partial [Rhodothermales bacterium]|nr:IPT/TIG domain-containing protein [Rhodothermales bacterium]